MSFLGDIVDSIGSGKAPTPPKPVARPPITNLRLATSNATTSGGRTSLPAIPSPLNGTKRKADEESNKLSEKHVRPNATPGLAGTAVRRTAAPPLNAPKPSQGKAGPVARPKVDPAAPVPKAESTPPVTPTVPNAKPPGKGSFAELMARAKQAQEAKSQNQVGMIKHQATNREKVSKLAERRRLEEEKVKAAKEKAAGRSTIYGRIEKKRSVSPMKKSDQPKAPRVARPPLHAPAASYRGTMGMAASKPRLPANRKKSRYDEYLATDEEDNSDVDEDEEEGDYDSDASSDMEAGAFDIDEEESLALRAAKEDDARELAEENRLKREKEERRKRLISLAGKRK